MPLQLFASNGLELVNVTTQYPALIARDAALWLKAYKTEANQKWADTTGVIAAWAADEDLLGNRATVASYLDARAAAGHLNTPLAGTPRGRKFVTTLDAFLKSTGYLN